MINSRYPRSAKFRKRNEILIISFKIVAIWYITFLTIGYLTSNTGAYFTANDEETTTIQAGYWDESKLEFIKKGNNNLNEFICPTNEFEISTVLKDVGKTDMLSEGTFEVYYVENGEPSVNGSKVSEGKITKLLKGQELVLTQKVTSEGFYMFKTFEDSGQNKEKVIWSEKIKVKCKATPIVPKKEGAEPSTPSDKDQPKENPKIGEPKEDTFTEIDNSDSSTSNQNIPESENNNDSTVEEEELMGNESKNNN